MKIYLHFTLFAAVITGLIAGRDSLSNFASVKDKLVAVDSTYGRLVSKVISPATFYIFLPARLDEAVLRVDGMDRTMRYGGPEMSCFLANHTKDELRVTYYVYEREDENGKKIRTDEIERVVVPKSGDDTNTWLQKEQADSLLMRRHHETLKKVMEDYH